MPDSPLLQHPRHRFVAFSAVGVAMVCLPLWQVLRYQQSDLHQLAAERALLDPVAQAVHVQFGLLAHRQVAAQLLQGQPRVEPARMAVQVGVDEKLRALAQQLEEGLWSHALAETRDLTRDWQQLAQKVRTSAITAPQSNEAHALRVEQAVQVVDLVTLTDAVSDSGAAARSFSSTGFPHLARHVSLLAADAPGPDGYTAASLGAAKGRLSRHLKGLEAALTPAASRAISATAAAAADPAADTRRPALTGPLAAALAEVGRTSSQVLRLQAAEGQRPLDPDRLTPLQKAQQQAHEAQLALFNQALGQHKRVLAQRQHQVQRQQWAVLAALTLLGAAALALGAGLLRQLRSPPVPVPVPPGPAPSSWRAGESRAQPVVPPSSTKAEASRLFSRLRTPADTPAAHKEPGQHEPEDTSPPDRG